MIIFLNEEHFLEEAIRSVFAQTYEAWELMLVDDGSTDRSSTIARKYAEDHRGRVCYLEHPGHENRGMSASRNLGFLQTKGRYIALLDGDDVWLPNKLTDQVAILDAHPEAAMVYGRTRFWHGWTGAPEHRRRDWWTPLGVEANRVVNPPVLVTNFLKDENTVVSNCSVLVRREVIEEVGGWDNSFRTMYEDMVLWTKVLSQWPAFVSDGSWDLYRQHPGNSGFSAAAAGIWDPLGPNESRRRFLEWMSLYLQQRGVTDTELLATLTEQLEPYHESALLQLSRRATSMVRRLRVAGWLLSERVRASRLSQAVRTSRILTRVLGPVPDYVPPVGYVQFGDLRRLEPLNRSSAPDKETPVDQHYIQEFVGRHAKDIQGRVLAFGDSSLTRAFGGSRVSRCDVWAAPHGSPESTIVSEMIAGEGVASDLFDCIVCTNALSQIYDVEAAVRTLFRIVKPGGVVLVVLPGMTAVRHQRDERDDDCWRFTEGSARRLFEEYFSASNVNVWSQGNVFATVAYLQGVTTQRLDVAKLKPRDPRYPLVVSVRAVKPDGTAPRLPKGAPV